MRFDELLGNQRLKQLLEASLEKGHISHFYLISGPEGSGKHTLARLLAAALMCERRKVPCLSCDACRKVLAGTHPDYITIDDDEKRYVPVELVRQARADIYIQPNEGARKIYLLPRAQDMLPPAQNALLKVLEEPPAYGVFLLLTDNPEQLLPTIRSRCTELKLQPLPQELLHRQLTGEFPDASTEDIRTAALRGGGYLGPARQILKAEAAQSPQTAAFAAAFAARDSLGLLQVLAPMEKWKRDPLISELAAWRQLLEEALVCRSGGIALGTAARELASQRPASELMAAISQLQKVIEYAQGNVSPAAICGHLEWSLR